MLHLVHLILKFEENFLTHFSQNKNYCSYLVALHNIPKHQKKNDKIGKKIVISILLIEATTFSFIKPPLINRQLEENLCYFGKGHKVKFVMIT